MATNLNMFNQSIEAQKNMFEVWQKMFNPISEELLEKNSKDLMNYNPLNYFKEIIELSNKLSSNYMGDPYQVLNKINESTDAYYSVFKIWQKLKEDTFEPTAEAMKVAFEEWREQYSEYMNKHYIPLLPEPMKKVLEQSMSVMESYRSATNKFWEPWIGNEKELSDAFFRGLLNDPSAYLEYLKLWKENYDNSFSKFLNTPMMGINRELLEKQFDSLDKYIRFNVHLNEYLANIYKLGQETMKKTLNDYAAMYKEGMQPKSFEEFYKYWTKEINNAFDRLFFSDDFSKLVGHTLDAMTSFKIEVDKLWEEYLTFMPIAKKSEMDSLYKTVYEMKKEIKSLRKELDELRALKEVNSEKEKSKK